MLLVFSPQFIAFSSIVKLSPCLCRPRQSITGGRGGPVVPVLPRITPLYLLTRTNVDWAGAASRPRERDTDASHLGTRVRQRLPAGPGTGTRGWEGTAGRLAPTAARAAAACEPSSHF